MSEQNIPYCVALNNITNTVNHNTGTFASKVQLATISSGLELPAIFSLDIYVGTINTAPNRGKYFRKGYLFGTPRLFHLTFDQPNLRFFIDGKIEYLHRISETTIEGGTVCQYKVFHNPVKDMQVLFYKKDGSGAWFEVIYADGTIDIFDWRGVLEKRVSPLGHSLIFTFIDHDDHFFLEKVEDEYGHAKIKITYGPSLIDDDGTSLIKKDGPYIGESHVFIEELQEDKIIKKISINLTKDVERNFEYVSSIVKYKEDTGAIENKYEYSYSIFKDQNYYLTKYSEDFKKIIEFGYKKIPSREDTGVYAISKLRTYENDLSDTYLLTEYLYSNNTYTGVTKNDSLHPDKKENYDMCMMYESDYYTYYIVEYHSVVDKNYPNENKDVFFTVRTFNKYHLLISEETGFSERGVITGRKEKYVNYSYDNILKENNGSINLHLGNYSFWTTKTTTFFKDGEEPIVEIEKQETLETGFPSKIIDKRGLEKHITYHSPTNNRGAISLQESITTISEDNYNKTVIDYTKVDGKEVSIPDSNIKIQPVAYLPFKVTTYKDKDDKGLVAEENKYDFNPSPTSKEFFFFAYKKETKKNGDLILGNCLIENITYSYSDSTEKLILLQSYKSNIAKNGDPEEKTIIKCAILSTLTKLPMSEWYQLSLDDKTQYNLISSTYDCYRRILTKISDQGKESYDYYFGSNPCDTNDLTWYKRYDYTDIYGGIQITLSNFYNQVVKIYGLLPGQFHFNILEENKYMAYRYLKENIIYDYLSSSNEAITNKIVYDYKKFRLLKSTFSDGTFETYEYDEYFKVKKTEKNHCLKQVTFYDFSNNILKESIIDSYDIEYPLLTKKYDKYNRISYFKTASGSTEHYFYDSFNRLVKKNINIDASSNYGYTEELIYPETALNSDKIIAKIAKSKNEDENFCYSALYNNYGQIIYENETSYCYDLLKEEQLNKVQNAIGEVNYTYYLENDLPKTINYIQKKEEEPFETIYDAINYNYHYNLLSYTVKNLENNIEKNCGQINYTYTSLGGIKSFELKVGENVKDLQSAVLITNNYSAYENLLFSTNYKCKDFNFELKNTYDKTSVRLKTVEYTFGESESIKFELIYNSCEPQTFSFGRLDSITMTSPHFLINNTLNFTYDKQGRECGRNYYDISDIDDVILYTSIDYQIDTSQIRSTSTYSSQNGLATQLNSYDKESGKLKGSTTTSEPNLKNVKHEDIYPLSINRIRAINTIDEGLEKKDSYFYTDSNKKDTVKLILQDENNKQINKIEFNHDSCGNYTNDFDNSKIIYNAANKIINLEKKETLEKYNYYYYMSGELMCVSEIKVNPRKIYYLYDNGKNIGELIYEGTILKIATLYLDVHGVRLGRYIKDYEQNKELIELFFSELGGTVHKVISYEKYQGITKKESYKYDLYGEKKTL